MIALSLTNDNSIIKIIKYKGVGKCVITESYVVVIRYLSVCPKKTGKICKNRKKFYYICDNKLTLAVALMRF